MNSVKCGQCGFVGWSDVDFCKKCGAPLASSAQPYAYNQQGAYSRSNGGELKNGLAISALVIGIVNLFTLGLLGIGAILGIVLAVIALSKIKQFPHVYGGKQLATAGLVTSILSIVIIVPIGIIAAIAIPNLLASRRAANEGSAMSSMRKIANAEATFQATHETYGTLEQLAEAGLIDAELASGQRHGYKFKVTVVPAGVSYPMGFEGVGVPAEYGSSGRRSFLVDETGVIRVADNRGGDPTRSDPPLEVDYSTGSPVRRRANPALEY